MRAHVFMLLTGWLFLVGGCSFILPFDQDGQPCDMEQVDSTTGEFGACLDDPQRPYRPTWYAVVNTDGGTRCLCRREDAGMPMSVDSGM